MKKLFLQFVSIFLIQLFLITNQGFSLAVTSGFQGTTMLIDSMKKEAELLQAQQGIKTKFWTDMLGLRTFEFFYTQQGKIEKVRVIDNETKNITEINVEDVKIDVPGAKADEVFMMDWETQGVWVDFKKDNVVIRDGIRGGGQSASSLLQDGNERYNQGKQEEAIKKYTKIINRNRNSREQVTIDAYNNRGWSYYELGEFDKALMDFNKALELNPNYALAYYNRAHFYRDHLNHYELAIADFNVLISLEPRKLCHYIERGNLYLARKEFDLAERDYTRVIDLYKNPPVLSGEELFNFIIRNGGFFGQAGQREKDKQNAAAAYCNRGNIYRQQEKYQKALNDLNESIKLSQDIADSYFYRGMVFQEMQSSNPQNMELALQDFNKAIELKPNDACTYDKRAYLWGIIKQEAQKAFEDYNKAVTLDSDCIGYRRNRGVCYVALGKHKEAMDDFNEVLKRDAKDALAYKLRGDLYKTMKNYELAIADYKKAIELGHDTAEAHNGLGFIYQDQKRYAEALREYREAIRLAPQEVVYLKNIGYTHRVMGKYEEAERSFREAISKKQDDAEAHNGLGAVCQDQKRYDEALREYGEAIRLAPQEVVYLKNIGYTYRVMGKYEEAERSFREAISKKQDDAEAHNGLGAVCQDQKRYDEALREYREAIRLVPQELLYFRNIGYTYRAMGNYEEAERIFREALSKKQDDAEAHNGLGTVYLDQKRYIESLREFEEAIRICPQEVVYCKNKGQVYVEMKDYARAIIVFTEAISLNARDEAVYNWRGLIYLLNLNNKQRAIEDFIKTIELYHDENNEEFGLIYRGNLAHAQGNYEEAERLYTEYIIKKVDNNGSVHYVRGRVRALQGNRQGALEDYRQAMRLGWKNVTMRLDLEREKMLTNIWEGKYGEYQFVPFAMKREGEAVGAMYEKQHTKPGALGSKKVWLGKVDTEDRKAIREKISSDIFDYYGVTVPKTRLSIQDTRNPFIADNPKYSSMARERITDGLGRIGEGNCVMPNSMGVFIMSKWFEGYRNLGEGYIEGIIGNNGKPPETIVHEGRTLSIKGIMRGLAVARFLGDTDFLGGAGKNAGYVVKRDEQGEYAEFVKIDPGETFNFTITRTVENSTQDPENSGKTMTDSKNMFIGNTLSSGRSGRFIKYESFTQLQREEFLQTMMLITETKDEEIEELVKRRGKFNRDKEYLTNIQQQLMIDQLKDRRDLMRRLYGQDIEKYIEDMASRVRQEAELKLVTPLSAVNVEAAVVTRDMKNLAVSTGQVPTKEQVAVSELLRVLTEIGEVTGISSMGFTGGNKILPGSCGYDSFAREMMENIMDGSLQLDPARHQSFLRIFGHNVLKLDHDATVVQVQDWIRENRKNNIALSMVLRLLMGSRVYNAWADIKGVILTNLRTMSTGVDRPTFLGIVRASVLNEGRFGRAIIGELEKVDDYAGDWIDRISQWLDQERIKNLYITDVINDGWASHTIELPILARYFEQRLTIINADREERVVLAGMGEIKIRFEHGNHYVAVRNSARGLSLSVTAATPVHPVNSLSPVNYNSQARLEEEKRIVPELEIKKQGSEIVQIVQSPEPSIEMQNFIKAYRALNKLGLISNKDFNYKFKFYENTSSLGVTNFDVATGRYINTEINRNMLTERNYAKVFPRLLEVMIKEDLRTEDLPVLIEQINAMLMSFHVSPEKLLPVFTKEELQINKELSNRFEALLRLLSYKKFSEKFVELSRELGVEINWTKYWESIDYLYGQLGILMDDNPELRNRFGIKEPFNFYAKDRQLCEDLAQGGIGSVVESFIDGLYKADTITRHAA